MVASLRANRVALRRAVFASVVLHIGIGALLLLALNANSESKPRAPAIDTRADVVVRMFDGGPDEEARVTEAPSSAIEAQRPSAPAPEIARRPHADIVPRTLPSEMLAIIGRSVAARPVASASPVPSVPGIHGAMTPGTTVVYVLDCSGSMGQFGKFDLARAALLATLRAQPESVRFQVVAYNSSARALVAGTDPLPATLANIELAERSILAQAAKGRSNHVEAIRVATRYRPDAIVLLTDAEGLAREQFKSVLAALEKPTYIGLAKVSASSVGTPQELR